MPIYFPDLKDKLKFNRTRAFILSCKPLTSLICLSWLSSGLQFQNTMKVQMCI